VRIFYDWEFIEDGRTIDPVSVGMVTDDGREYYAVNSDFNQRRFRKSRWLMENVLPGLPQLHGEARLHYPKVLIDRHHPAVKPRGEIAHEVRDFILSTTDPELWAWYAAFDHVCLAWLWGPMIALPKGVPMWTNDLKQECVRLGDPRVPEQSGREHNALDDARHAREIGRFLDGLRTRDSP
jgi:3'-5' exoribonuclease Rv2179c-like domain